MRPTLIAGLGNAGFQDEAAGLYIVSQLEKNYSNFPFRLISIGNDILNLIPLYQGEKKILFISSGFMDCPAGEYCYLSVSEINDSIRIIGMNGIEIKTLFHEIPVLRQYDLKVLAFRIKWNEWGDELSPEVSKLMTIMIHDFWYLLERLNFA
ncbi:MAG: hydrogenase maturation protease [Calditrichia bacterium]